MTEDLSDISQQFLDENKKLCTTRQKTGNFSKKGGPYSKPQREKRRAEVYKLHFGYGYTAVDIAELMKLNRNTINEDIRFWYLQLSSTWDNLSIYDWAMKQITRLEIQRTRLMEKLDKDEDPQIQLSLEKIATKTHSTRSAMIEEAVAVINSWASEHKLDLQFIRDKDLVKTSTKTHEQIVKLISDDRKRMLGL